MGNVLSIGSAGKADATGVFETKSETMNGTQATCSKDFSNIEEEFHDAINSSEKDNREKAKQEAMAEFRNELNLKREQRKTILARHREEKEGLEKALSSEKNLNLKLCEENKLLRELIRTNDIEIPTELVPNTEDADITQAIIDMREEVDKLKSNNLKLRKDLSISNKTLQEAYSDIADLNVQNTESIKQIHALKEVVRVSKTLIGLREQQLNELKDKLSDIEQSLADREANMLSTDLRHEYERQLQNIRTLRGLYEERARLAEVTKQGLVREVEDQKAMYQIEVNKSNELRAQITNLESQVDSLKETIESKDDQIRSSQNETRILQSEMTAVNKLFSQVLLGYKNKHDLDKLVHRLEDNHGLLTQMAEKENGSEASSALPKLLLELVSQIDEKDQSDETSIIQDAEPNEQINNAKFHFEEQQDIPANATVAEIVENLPKVWRVLMELLSHQNVVDTSSTEKTSTCYKSIETKSGSVLVPSVSQTYIRLKDLIIEKLALIKEVNKMKQLNAHLESRLGEQEQRLCLVTTELSKTWHVVGRLRRHHHQLHTHEKILKYELQQKRKLLNELKEELEYCREKWEQAREKNSQSEKDWKKLRAEFTSRKTKVASTFNNSAESGYSDERQSDETSDSNDESECLNEPIVRSRKKLKKSFETVLDSSTDFNVAEREDPVSDMLDVADLPLDAHEVTDNQQTSISDFCNTESVAQSEIGFVETEDEVGDICNELCIGEQMKSESSLESLQTVNPVTDSSAFINLSTEQLNDVRSLIKTSKEPQVEMDSKTTPSCSRQITENKIPISVTTTPIINPKEILNSIMKQNERLTQKDKRFETLESTSKQLVKQSQNTVKFADNLNYRLDNLLTKSVCLDSQFEKEISGHMETISNDDESHIENHENIYFPSPSSSNLHHDSSKVNTDGDQTINPTQNDDQALREKRRNKLESEKSIDVQTIKDTLPKTNETVEKLVHNSIKQDENEHTDDDVSEREISEESDPSISAVDNCEVNHEARFAARDLRLRRLEEQTKSLVNKVNKTTSKGVKIHYKLEELHNIYGSEGSRAETPSEGNEDLTDGDGEMENE